MKLTIIGGGPGGYTAAFAAAKAGVEVTLVERAHLGGTCLHTGCIPTKTLRSSADALDTVARLREFGIAGDCAATPDMSAIVARKRKVTATLQTGLEKTAAQLKVRVVRGDAEFVGAGLVRVASVDGSLEIAGDRVILATGSSPLELPSLPVDHRLVLSSDDALELQTVPEHLVVVGGGVIGCELAFIYRAFGAKVTVIEGQGRLLPLPSVDGEISRLLLREMKTKGIAVELSHTVSRVTPCAHMAAAEAHTAVHNILHPEKKKVQSYTVVPSAIFTSPEIGDVGLTEEQAREQGIAARSAVFQFRELGKAQAMGALSGLFKIVAEEGTGKLLGVHIAGAHASDLIAEATFALQKGCSARDLFETIHAHPTLSEGLYEAAGMLA